MSSSPDVTCSKYACFPLLRNWYSGMMVGVQYRYVMLCLDRFGIGASLALWCVELVLYGGYRSD